MFVVELQCGVHSVNYSVLLHKSGELMHDLSNQTSGVLEAVHNITARDHLVILIHTVMKPSDTLDVVDLMDNNLFGCTGNMMELDKMKFLLLFLIHLSRLDKGHRL